ncbi:MAG: hypothetical protein J7M27_05105 [Candidatus Latescibacteria bacterium]|nr:hypothetical protein [Candidatus Latescibacterota bacterium]
MTEKTKPRDVVFKTQDYEGTPVILSRTTWRVKAGNDEPGEHPEVRDYLDDIHLAIEKPDSVFQSPRDERSRVFYRLNVGRGRFTDKHLVIVVKYVMEPQGLCGYISTIYLSRAVYARGEQLWPKTQKLVG